MGKGGGGGGGEGGRGCLLVACLSSLPHASVTQGRICEDRCTCCHTETEIADQTFCLTQPQYTDNGPTSPNADPITSGALQCSHCSASCFLSHWYDPTRKKIASTAGTEPRSANFEADALTTRPVRLLGRWGGGGGVEADWATGLETVKRKMVGEGGGGGGKGERSSITWQ